MKVLSQCHVQLLDKTYQQVQPRKLDSIEEGFYISEFSGSTVPEGMNL
jgi:hypothetical protein